MQTHTKKSIAVVGGGVAGIVSAYLLQGRHDVRIFEKNPDLGGHTCTVTLKKGPDAGACVDIGFIVFNDRTYPNFMKFLEQLGVDKQKSNMSFSYFDRRSGFQYASSNLFADRKNLFQPRFWRFLKEILRFNRKTRELLQSTALKTLTLGQYLNKYGFQKDLIEKYIIPMGGAIWSTPDEEMLAFPAESFARFFSNHGLLNIRAHPQWYTVVGGSHAYVKAFEKQFAGRIHTECPITAITREDGRIRIAHDKGDEIFDAVVIATHADEALTLLADPTPDEKRLLGPWRYSENQVQLHTDPSFMPPLERARASWNYIRERPSTHKAPLSMSYYMNKLQNLRASRDYLVTLNPGRPIHNDITLKEQVFTHPMYTFDAIKSQSGLAGLSGNQNTYYCGSYFRYGFHEDAVQSAVDVGRKFGVAL